MTDEDLPTPLLEAKPERRTPSLVWLVPIAAVIVALGLLWREYVQRGQIVEIVMPNARGLTEGVTPIRFRDVEVGRIEKLRFAPNLSSVVAEARIEPEIAPFVDEGAAFWVVRPQVSAQGVTGLETVISGAYIEGVWDAEAGLPARRFEILTAPPLTSADTPGKRVTLRAADGGSLGVGAPIFYRRVEVGRVEARRLTADGTAVEFDVFINAPNDVRLTEDTRFWNVSGVDLSFGADGAQLRIASLASLIQGGAAFDDLSGGAAAQVPAGHEYILYSTETDARERAIEADESARLLLDVYFEGSVRGLRVGAPVEFQGIRVGSVVDVAAEVDPGEAIFVTRTTIAISPPGLGLAERDVDGALSFMEGAVAQGLRAQLSTGNLFTGSLVVNLAVAPADAPKRLERRDGRPPRLPSIPSDLDELAGSIEGVLKRVDGLPIEALFANALLLLENVNAVVGSQEARAIPGETVEALSALSALLSSPALNNAPKEAEALLSALRETVEGERFAAAQADLASLLASAAAIAETLENDDLAGEAAGAAAALRARLDDPELARLVSTLNDSLAAATTLLSAPGLAETPAELNASLASLRAILDQPAARAAPRELAASLTAAREMLERLERENAAGELSAALVAARRLLDDPALRRLSSESAQAAAALRALLAAPGAEDLPASAAQAMRSAAVFMDQLREDDVAKVAADALASVRSASEAVRRAAAAAPELMAQIGSVSARADALLASVDVGSELNYETVTAIREIRDAARAITDLAGLVERRPNALILGK